MLLPNTSHDQKCHVIPYIDGLDVSNAVVWFTMLPASCDADSGASGITWPKGHVVPNIDHLHVRNTLLTVMMPSLLCNIDTGTNGVT